MPIEDSQYQAFSVHILGKGLSHLRESVKPLRGRELERYVIQSNYERHPSDLASLNTPDPISTTSHLALVW